MIAFRVDANRKIASGHVMRCLAIADALRQAGKDCLFITADEYPLSLIEDYGFPYLVLQSQYDNLEQELVSLTTVIIEQQITLLLIDSYYVTEQYITALCNHTRTAYIDDLYLFDYPVDVLINYSIYANTIPYKLMEHTKLLAGIDYTPLRAAFSRVVTMKPAREVENIFISFGGADYYNLSGRVATCLLENCILPSARIHIVAGIYNSSIEELEKLSQVNDRVCLYKNVKEMDKLMVQMDIAVCAGGTTMYELFACHVPVVTLSFADNTMESLKHFAQRELIYYVGDIRENDALIYEAAKAVEKIGNDDRLRCSLAEKMRALNIGDGAYKIAEVLMNQTRR